MAETRSRDLGSQVRLGAMLLALFILVLFIVLNFETVDVDLLLTSPDAPLGVALIVSAVLGFLVGYFFPRRR